VSDVRVGLGFDVHPFRRDESGGDGALVLGGVTLPGETGLSGHSDADVVAHAVADAVLSPAGLPDLGTLFPASDDSYRGARSLDILREAVSRVKEAGWWVVNVDVVIAAERPALAPHVAQMSANLTEVLRAAQEPMGSGVLVTVKPKRGEGIGAIGRGEGIAVWAVALLERG
jgi:2-C-methyl-D-erythritol 2,4-cyclodiphosphate synthase